MITKEQILERCSYDLNRAQQIWSWLSTDTNVKQYDLSKYIHPYTDERGRKYIEFDTGIVNFRFYIKKLSENDLNWEDAKRCAANNGMKLPSKAEFEMLDIFRSEFDILLEELGGDKLEGWLWSRTEFSGYNAWLYNGTSGGLSYNLKMNSSGVRGVLAFDRGLPLLSSSNDVA